MKIERSPKGDSEWKQGLVWMSGRRPAGYLKLILWTPLYCQSWIFSASQGCVFKSWLGCSEYVLLFRVLLVQFCCENWHFLWVWRHLAGLVEDDKEDEDEDANHRVTNNGHNGPHGQARPQIVLHDWLDGHIRLQRWAWALLLAPRWSFQFHRFSLILPSGASCPCVQTFFFLPVLLVVLLLWRASGWMFPNKHQYLFIFGFFYVELVPPSRSRKSHRPFGSRSAAGLQDFGTL